MQHVIHMNLLRELRAVTILKPWVCGNECTRCIHFHSSNASPSATSGSHCSHLHELLAPKAETLTMSSLRMTAYLGLEADCTKTSSHRAIPMFLQ